MATSWCEDRSPDSSPETSHRNEPEAIPQNGVIDIIYTVSKTTTQDKIVGTFKVGSNVVAQITYTAPAGFFFENGGTESAPKPKLRFIRFMSLVPLDGTMDDADNTTMEASMTDFKLGNSAWGNSLIDYAWSVQGANIENLKISNLAASSIGANADYIKIRHRYQLH